MRWDQEKTTEGRKDTITIVIIITLNWAMQVFNEIQVMTAGGPGNATQTLGNYMYTAAWSYDKFGYASAIGNLILIITVVLAFLQMNISGFGNENWYVCRDPPAGHFLNLWFVNLYLFDILFLYYFHYQLYTHYFGFCPILWKQIKSFIIIHFHCPDILRLETICRHGKKAYPYTILTVSSSLSLRLS